MKTFVYREPPIGGVTSLFVFKERPVKRFKDASLNMDS